MIGKGVLDVYERQLPIPTYPPTYFILFLDEYT